MSVSLRNIIPLVQQMSFIGKVQNQVGVYAVANIAFLILVHTLSRKAQMQQPCDGVSQNHWIKPLGTVLAIAGANAAVNIAVSKATGSPLSRLALYAITMTSLSLCFVFEKMRPVATPANGGAFSSNQTREEARCEFDHQRKSFMALNDLYNRSRLTNLELERQIAHLKDGITSYSMGEAAFKRQIESLENCLAEKEALIVADREQAQQLQDQLDRLNVDFARQIEQLQNRDAEIVQKKEEIQNIQAEIESNRVIVSGLEKQEEVKSE